MDNLYAFWRMEYIEAPREEKKPRGNPFVEIPKENNDRKNLVVERGKHCYIILNAFPYNAGHMMVIPYREAGDLSDLSVEERNDLMHLTVRAKEILQYTSAPHGFNIGYNLGSAAGAGIPQHLHCHIVPRWNGDTNFMPVIGKTRVLPQSLEAAWEKTQEALKNMSPLYSNHAGSNPHL